MAKKKKPVKRKTTHHRRKHQGIFGATGGFNLMNTLELGGGLVVGNTLGIMVQKHLTMVPQKLLALGELVVGIMHTNHPNAIMRGAAYGFAGAGASGFAHETGILRGVDEVISGMRNGHTLSGTEEYEMHQLNGMYNDTTLGEMNQAEPQQEMPQVRYEPMPDAMPMGY